MSLVCAPVQKTTVPASPRSMDELVESAFRTRMQLFSLVPTLQSGSKTYESTSFRLRWSFYLVTTNIGIPGRRVVRRRQRGIAISFCAVLLKLSCVLLIARIETIRRQASRNDMETDIPICANMKYGYLNTERYYYFPRFLLEPSPRFMLQLSHFLPCLNQRFELTV